MGEFGNDIAFGGAGDDELLGGSGDDSLIGGADDDLIVGGPGNDNPGGDGSELAFLSESAAYESILGYADKTTGEAVVVLANTATEEAAGQVADLALPKDVVWFLVPNGHRYTGDVEAGGGYTLVDDGNGNGSGGYRIEDADGGALRGVFDNPDRGRRLFLRRGAQRRRAGACPHLRRWGDGVGGSVEPR